MQHSTFAPQKANRQSFEAPRVAATTAVVRRESSKKTKASKIATENQQNSVVRKFDRVKLV